MANDGQYLGLLGFGALVGAGVMPYVNSVPAARMVPYTAAVGVDLQMTGAGEIQWIDPYIVWAVVLGAVPVLVLVGLPIWAFMIDRRAKRAAS